MKSSDVLRSQYSEKRPFDINHVHQKRKNYIILFETTEFIKKKGKNLREVSNILRREK